MDHYCQLDILSMHYSVNLVAELPGISINKIIKLLYQGYKYLIFKLLQ